ncbi:MAG: LysM domain-containing protein [Thermonemataceae bacterium]|nr:LysM domain-containing protein [Thermonemataceae bacterium]
MSQTHSHIISHKGSKAVFNQSYALKTECSQGYLWLIAESEGDKASQAARLAADTFRCYIEDNFYTNPQDLLRKAILETNNELFKNSLHAELALAFVGKNAPKLLYMASFGKNKILVEQDKKILTSSNENFILGEQAVIQPVVSEVEIKNNEKIVLLSKGAFAQLSQSDMQVVLGQKNSSEEKLHNLLDKALSAGGIYPLAMALIEFDATPFLETKLWKKTAPYLFPVFLVGVIVTFFVVAYYSQQAEKQAEEDIIAKNKQEQNKIARTKDSLARIDAKKDTIIVHKVARGETVGIVARKYNTTNEALMELNVLDDKASVARGQSLKVNVKMIYTFEKETTLQEVYEQRFKRWEKAGVNILSIKKANSDRNLEGKLKKGTKIIIPALQKDKY